MSLLVGTYNSYWGHTYIAKGNGKLYALRSLAEGSSLCVFEQSKCQGEDPLSIVTLDALGEKLIEVTTPGKHSCHITLLEHQAVLADYTSGTLSLFKLDEEGIPQPNPQIVAFEGSGPHPTRQTSPHIHSSWLSPDGMMLIVVDLGCDCLYRFDVADGRVITTSQKRIALPSGCGPRHCAFSPQGDILYVVTELSDEVLVYRTLDFALLNRYIAHPENPNGGGHILLSSDGNYLYVSIRVSSTAGADVCCLKDGISVFECLGNGELKHLDYTTTGGHPRHFMVTKDGDNLVVACRDNSKIEIYPLDRTSGLIGECVESIDAPSPVYVDEDSIKNQI